MRIKKLELKNFRGFEDLTIDFPEGEGGLAVFVGVNGAGKSSVLEAIASALLSVQNGLLPEGRGNFNPGINENQIRVVSHQLGSRISLEKQPEYKISTTATLGEKEIKWHSGSGGGDFQSVVDFTQSLCHKILNGGPDVLPMMAFYGTKRYWSDEKFEKIDVLPVGSRLDTYKDCLSPNISSQLIYEWFKRMKYIQLEDQSLDLPPELQAVNDAILKAIESLNQANPSQIKLNFSVKDNDLFINIGNGSMLPFRLLSEGYRITLGMIADIAYRMAELNSHERNATPGIVLIDEIELHLHPAWQRKIVQALRRTFPNIQFILTTHSPQVLSSVPTENVFVLKDFQLRKFPPYHTEDRDSNSILQEVFEVEARPDDGNKDLKDLYEFIDKNDRKLAEKKLEELKNKYGSTDAELVRAEMYVELMDE